MKDNLLRFFSTVMDSEVVSSSNRPEWLPCLHNICLLHGAINLRAKFPVNVGWQDPLAMREVNIEHLKVGNYIYSFQLQSIWDFAIFFLELSRCCHQRIFWDYGRRIIRGGLQHDRSFQICIVVRFKVSFDVQAQSLMLYLQVFEFPYCTYERYKHILY